MSGLAWVIVGILVMIGGLAFAAYLMNLPSLLILAGSGFSLLILFLLVTRGPRSTSLPVETPEPAAPPTAPAGDEPDTPPSTPRAD